MAVSDDDPASRQRGNRRVMFGVAVSLAVHALLLLAYRNTSTSALETALTAPMSILVTIAPPTPPPAPPPEQRAEPAKPPAPSPSRALPRAARRAPPTAVIAVPDTPAAAPEAFVVQEPEAPAPAAEAPAFNMEAARQVARASAKLRDPAKAGTALAQFPEPALQTETPLARGIAAAKRRDCKDGVPGGLLAPIFLLMDKKDSGCKW